MDESQSNQNDPAYLYLQEKLERRKRLRVIAAGLPGGVAFLLILLRFLNPDLYIFPGVPTYSYLYTVFTIGCLAMSGIGLLMMYLQTGFKKTSVERSQIYEVQNELTAQLREMEHRTMSGTDRFEKLEKQILDVTSKLNKAQVGPQLLTANDKVDLINVIKQKLETEAASTVISEITRKATESIRADEQHKFVSVTFRETLNRLREEVVALSRRGNLNLALGIITTVTGLAILGYFVVQSTNQGGSAISFAMGFIPRLSLVILIEVFAYFFLRLYKASLSEIKYFQNEMTNVESKYISLHVALISGNSESCNSVIKDLCATERNHILEKGQTTVELEKVKVDKEEIVGLLKVFSEFVKKQK